ncbi:MAG: glycosyltransferase family 2 protein [Parcubacteria group bacterium]|nr:glycosyltransferase family 2 protein [Parcubacteria group bacterium]
METTKISVVIATYNRDHLVTRALAALARQNLPKGFFEIIVVNDGSTDGTEEEVKNFIKKNTSSYITLITLEKNLGSSFARNTGILSSKGEFIAITDDDCIVPSDWLSQFLKAFETNPEIIAVGGFKKPHRDNGLKPSRYDIFMFWRRLPFMKTECKSVEMNPFNNCGDTANVCYRKQALEAVGGFNNDIRTFNDWELKIRLHQLGSPLLYRPIFIPHEADLKFGKFLKYWLRLGYDCFLISKIHPEHPVFNTSLRTTLRRIIAGVSRIIKAPSDEIFSPYGGSPARFAGASARREGGQKKISQTLFFIFLEIILNTCLWLGKYITPKIKKALL